MSKITKENPLPKLVQLLEERKRYLTYKRHGGKMSFLGWQATMKLREYK